MLGNINKSDHAPTIDVIEGGGEVVAALSGRIDIDFAPVLRFRILALLQARNCKSLSIDFSQITHIDSSGIATLIEALKIARTNGAILKLQGLQGRLLRLLEVTGILPMFNGHDNDTSQVGDKAV